MQIQLSSALHCKQKTNFHIDFNKYLLFMNFKLFGFILLNISKNPVDKFLKKYKVLFFTV